MRKTIRRRTPVLILILLAAVLFPQEKSLDALIDLALENNNDVRMAKYELAGAKALKKGSFSGFLPRVDFSMTKSLNTVPDSVIYSDNLGNVYTLANEDLSMYSSLSIRQIVFDGARSWFSNRTTANAINFAQAGLQNTVERVVLSVKSAYYNYLSALALEDVAKFSLELADSQLDLVQQQYDLQAVSETDLLKAKVRRGQSEAQLLRSKRSVKSAMNNLCLAVGSSADCGLEVERMEVSLLEPPPFDQAFAKLREQNSALQLARLRTQGAELSYKTQYSVFLPTISLGMDYTSSSSDLGGSIDGLMQTHPTSFVSLSLPLFTGLSNKSRLDQLKYDLLSSEIDAENTEDELATDLDDLLTSLETYQMLIPINEEIITSAQLDVDLVEKKYHLGSSDILDVLNAQNSLIQAKSDLVRIKHEAKIYEAQLNVLLGEY